MLLRLAYLGLANAFALLRLLSMSERDKDAAILAAPPAHRAATAARGRAVRFTPSDRALLVALLHRLPRRVVKNLHLVRRPGPYCGGIGI